MSQVRVGVRVSFQRQETATKHLADLIPIERRRLFMSKALLALNWRRREEQKERQPALAQQGPSDLIHISVSIIEGQRIELLGSSGPSTRERRFE
jgi:hypothetical protein